jgi:putative transposase
LRRPLESAQYTSIDYTQTLDDHRVLASVGSVGDAYDNALAESFVDSYKTELIADRVWCSRAQLELATVEWVGWFNHDRLHESLGDIPPVEFEQLRALEGPISPNGSVAGSSPRAAERLRTPRSGPSGASEHANGTEIGPPADERAAGGSLRSRYALAALTAGAQPTTIR